MTVAPTAIKIGATMALGTMAIQAAEANSGLNNIGVVAMVLPIVSAVIGAAVSYGILSTMVKRMEQDVRELRHDISQVYTLVRDSMTKVAHIEGRIGRSE